jgi:hypothetical protein
MTLDPVNMSESTTLPLHQHAILLYSNESDDDEMIKLLQNMLTKD